MTRARGSALHVAVERENIPIIRMLLEKGAAVNLMDHKKRTPFDMTQNVEVHRVLAQGLGADAAPSETFSSQVYIASKLFKFDKKVILRLNTPRMLLEIY